MTLSLRRLRAWLRLLRLVRSFEKQLREFMRLNYNTTLPRFDVAAALHRHGGAMKMSELSKMLLVSNGNATSVVKSLEQEGTVQRVTLDTDKRVVLVELTQEGRAWFSEIAEAHEQKVNQMLSGLSDENLNELRQLIKMAEAANNTHHNIHNNIQGTQE